MQDFEKLGVFYLGKEYDLQQNKLQEEAVLYKSKDMTTHAVIIGMTGSGKTGLGISILEEAAIDNIPVIAIDPKGDLANLALTFPNLQGKDFFRWINLHDAANKGVSADEYAEAQAQLWRKGLTEWGQDETRIKKFRDAADVAVYTPGGSAGIGISVLQSFKAPSREVLEDKDAYRDRIQITTTGLLSLIGQNGDPFTSREHILIANILEYTWNQGRSLSLSELIAAIQTPPLKQVGVMDLESFYPSKERFALAMMLNNLLASPGFKAWLEGEPLDINRFLYKESGKPRISVFSIAHLADGERMFFVTMLLNEILTWMRSQPGTGSLRALLYMDEIFGYLPPTANPPSKAPLLTLLKQARAFGLGLVLSTQNPVDLDYKALSNAGTWFIGRLQTEQDKQRVLAGLEGAAAGGIFDKKRTEQILAGLGQRIFYLHSVHQDEPRIFQTRWTLSYLAGPLTRDQIYELAAKQGKDKQTDVFVVDGLEGKKTAESTMEEAKQMRQDLTSASPMLAPTVKQLFLPVYGGAAADMVYVPSVIGVADVLYSSTKNGVTATKNYTFLAPLHEGPVALNWNEAKQIELDARELEEEPTAGISFAKYPEAAANPRSYENWKKLFIQYIRTNLSLKLYVSPVFKIVSDIDEDERSFRIRLQHFAHEQRDEAVEALKKKYSSKFDVLEERQRRAQQMLEKQSTRATQKKMEAAVSAGTAILGALFGRKSISPTPISRVGTAVKSTTRAFQSGEGIDQAQETLQSIASQLEELRLELESQIEKISDNYGVLEEKFEETEVRALSENITVHLLGLAWSPVKK